MEPLEWAAIARVLWGQRRKLLSAAALLAPFALTMMLLVFVLFAGGGATSPAATVLTPQCQHQLQSQGIGADTGKSFGPGPVNNGNAVIATGLQMKIPEKGIIVALATGLTESNLRNLANPKVPESQQYPHEGQGYDHLSVGIMQQQPWWGTIRDLMTPAVAAQKFYLALLKVGGWQNMAPTVAAQTVQGSQFPDAYAKNVGAATLFYRQHLREVQASSGEPAPPAEGQDPAGRDVCGAVENPDTAGITPGTPAGVAAVKFAEAEIGLPYVWGGGSVSGPTGGGFDCSGLVLYAIFQASGHRIALPHLTNDMVNYGRSIPRNAVAPGDLVFSNKLGHVAMVVNPTTVVEAQTFGVPVKLSPFPKSFNAIKRVL